MPAISEHLSRFTSRQPPESASGNPLTLTSTLAGPAAAAEIAQAWPVHALPQAVRDVWATAGKARLCADEEYGQWGLVLLSPPASAARTAQERAARPEHFRSEDVVLGEFLGDQELLVVDGAGGGSRILIALPLDQRSEWYTAAGDLGEFLTAYWRAGGDKFWQ